jgi:hypothetical protein
MMSVALFHKLLLPAQMPLDKPQNGLFSRACSLV